MPRSRSASCSPDPGSPRADTTAAALAAAGVQTFAFGPPPDLERWSAEQLAALSAPALPSPPVPAPATPGTVASELAAITQPFEKNSTCDMEKMWSARSIGFEGTRGKKRKCDGSDEPRPR